jgi:nitrite reductase (NADH) large subunit
VGLTSYFTHRDAEKLMLARLDWYREKGIELHVGDRAEHIDREKRMVVSRSGCRIAYDHLVLATGSYPFVPPIPGREKEGVFVYRTIEDLERIIAYAKTSKSAAVMGGGLLGLEAAKACIDLGLQTHVVEFADRLMGRQLDETGARYLTRAIELLGVGVHTGKVTEEITGSGQVEGLRFAGGDALDVDLVVIAAGIRPRDELAREAGLEIAERGGVVIDDRLQTTDPGIFAVGEVASHRGRVYGLVAPGYDMAGILAANLCGEDRRFLGGDCSAKLKLMGVEVASFGDYEADEAHAIPLTFEDPFRGTYKKLLFDLAGERLLGGILVGDTANYGTLLALSNSEEPLAIDPAALVGIGGEQAIVGADLVPDGAQVCSCNNVSKGDLCAAIREQGLRSIAEVKTCTRAGTGCGGCLPLATDIFKEEMKRAGITVKNTLCEHLGFTRQELFQLIKIKEYRSFDAVLQNEGSGYGCEICKPAVASILASLWNEHIGDQDTIQDTNDRFMANIQRQGLYSVVPRVPGGEITPDKLIALGKVAKQYRLYTKITGGQRVDLFGARVHQLPEIWEELIDAGFESGHAYGKALRTVKSCVGTTWCRFGVQDAVGFAIRVENRYKGIRAPHKIKSAVSGCTRECAEAQSKDFGLIATEKGWNLYVCGNGGTNPRHADLLVSDLDEATAIKTIDRFLMYYIHTADKLTRTSVWLEKLEGGIDFLRQVIIEDSLGICDKLEADMVRLVNTYRCEWTEVVRDPEKRKRFTHFANSGEEDSSVTFVDQRGQLRPGDWQDHAGHAENAPAATPLSREEWIPVGKSSGWPHDGGATIRYGQHQIAVYKFDSREEWFACQNLCPHKRDMVLSRGILGDENDTPKVACPMHKKTFCLRTGAGLSDPGYRIQTFPVKVEGGGVYVLLPPPEDLDALDMAEREPATCAGCSSPALTRDVGS